MKKALPVLGIILLLIILYFVYTRFNTKPISQTTNPGNISSSTVIENVPEVIVDPTWKTYSDKEVNFEFKYPSDWKFETIHQGADDTIGVLKYPDYGFYLYVTNHLHDYGIESAVTPENKLILVDNHKALIRGDQESSTNYDLRGDGDSVSVEIESAPFSTSSYEVSMYMDSKNHTKEMRKIFFGILSTFKFTK